MGALAPSTVAVVGGAGGIGRALVARLTREGSRVVVLDLPASLARYPVEGEAIPIDVLDAGAVRDAMRRLGETAGPLDGFVNLAGFNTGLVRLDVLGADDFDAIIGGNLRGAFLTVQAALPLMRDGGSVVLTSSGLSHNVRAGYGAYGAAKAGLNTLTRVFALENAARLRVNAVAPGAVDTGFLRGGTGRSDESAQPTMDMDAYARTIPMGRAAGVDDVVGPILFLLGQDSAFMTGQILWINGGQFMP